MCEAHPGCHCSPTSAPVNKIIPISTVDGPGARTSIFFQGCNIACGYCHNPETQRLCCNCGACVKGCPAGALGIHSGKVCWDAQSCIHCDQCIQLCPHFASPKVQLYTPHALIEVVRSHAPFVRGITVSGGECMLYPQFLTQLFGLAQEDGLNCLIDTNGTVDFSLHPDLLQVCDGVMLDVKSWDPSTYHALTQDANHLIVKKNLAFLANQNKLAEIRLVYLPGEVDGMAVLEGIAELLDSHQRTTRLKLIAFRNNGVKGRLAQTPSPTEQEMANLSSKAQRLGFTNIVMV